MPSPRAVVLETFAKHRCSAILRTAPAAARHVARLGDPAIEPAGIDEEGFLRLRIRL